MVGLDDYNEILRTSGKELMCDPMSNCDWRSHESQQQASGVQLVVTQSVNFVTPLANSKEHSPKQLFEKLIPIYEDQLRQKKASMISQISDYNKNKDLCLEAKLKDNYSCLES